MNHPNSISITDFITIFGDNLPVITETSEVQTMHFMSESIACTQKIACMRYNQGTNEVYSVDVQVLRDTQLVYGYSFVNPASRLIDIIERTASHVALESAGDWIEKATAIVRDQPFDERIVVELDLPHDTLHALMVMAHEKDVTFNEFVNTVLAEHCAKLLQEDVAHKVWTTKLMSGSGYGDDLFLQLPEELLVLKGWKVGDEIIFTAGDGFIEITKKD